MSLYDQNGQRKYLTPEREMFLQPPMKSSARSGHCAARSCIRGVRFPKPSHYRRTALTCGPVS